VAEEFGRVGGGEVGAEDIADVDLSCGDSVVVADHCRYVVLGYSVINNPRE